MSQELIDASFHGNIQKVKNCLTNGDDVHYDNDASLYWAVLNAHYNIAKTLLEHGANANIMSDQIINFLNKRNLYNMISLIKKYQKLKIDSTI